MERLSLLWLFVASMMFAAPVFATSNHDNDNNGDDDNGKACLDSLAILH
jgi:hypothetical protein